MSISISVEKSGKSSVKRLPFLPRFGLTVDFGGRRFTYRQTPVLETLHNLRLRGFSMRNFVEIAYRQLMEVEMPRQEKIATGERQKSRSRRKKAKTRGR